MSNLNSLTSEKKQAEVIALAFKDDYKFDLESTVERVAGYIKKHKLSDHQIDVLSKFQQSEMNGSDVQEEFIYLSKYISDFNADATQQDNRKVQSTTIEEQEDNSSEMTNTFFSTKGFHVHKALKNYPGIKPDAYQALYDDIKLAGVNHKPIILNEGKIADGRARYEICKKLKIPAKYIEMVISEENLITFLDSVHLHKKDLNKSQRAILALENLDRFEKKQDSIEDEKKNLKGKRTESSHDSRKNAAAYYIVSTGQISEASTLKEMENSKELYNRVKAGQLSLSLAKTLVKIVPNDTQLLDFLETYNLLPKDIRTLVKIKTEDQEFYDQILASPDSLKDNFSIFSFKKDYPDLFVQLKSGDITLEKAKEAKMNRPVVKQDTSIEKTRATDPEPESTPMLDKMAFDIEESLKAKINELAQKNGKSVSEFLSQLIENYNNDGRKDQ